MARRKLTLDTALALGALLTLGALVVGSGRDAYFWWQPAQRAAQAYAAGDYAASAAHGAAARRADWQGVACYRLADYGCAAEQFAATGDADAAAAYNLGNTLSQRGDYAGALTQYQRALRLRPDWREADANRELIAALIERLRPPADAESADGEPNQEADQMKFSDRANKGKAGEVSVEKLDPKALEQLWLRNVSTDPAAFLRLRFAAEASANTAQAGSAKVGGEAGVSRSTAPRLPNGPASGRHSTSEAGKTAPGARP